MLTINSIKKAVQTGSRPFWGMAAFALGIVILAMVSGCEMGPSPFIELPAANTNRNTPPALHPATPETINKNTANTNVSATAATPAPASYILREGDIVKVSFPGSPDLNTTQQIRTDGKINLPLVGEVDAAGLTTAELQKKLMKLYAPQLSATIITVEVQSSSFPVYVTGAVLHPGKISTDHPLTALDAIMEAGGFDYTAANLKDVIVIRQEGDHTKRYKLNLKKAMNGGENKPFYLKPSDIIYVPQKFNWF